MLIGKKLYFFIKIKFYFLFEWINTVIQYYSNLKFMIFDIFFNFIYLFINPYRTSTKFLKKKYNQKIHEYGETPLTEMEKITKNFDLHSSRILELGAGRGKISFWLHFFTKSQITAIEQIPVFVYIANFFIKIFKLKNIKFICDDFFNCDFNQFDMIYLYGTTLSDEKINALINKLKKHDFVKIITISYSLNEYDDSFICLKKMDIKFPWGTTEVFLNVKRS